MEEREDRNLSVTEETGKGKKENKYRHTIVTKESFCAVFALFSILAFLILVTDSAVFGEPGAYVRSLLIALFGYAAYPVALLCAYNCAMGFIGVRLFKKRAAVTAFVVTAVLAALVAHTVQTLYIWELPVDGYLSACFNAEDLARGVTVFGFVGALPVYLLATLTTEVGALVILSAIAVLSLYVTAKLVAGKAVKTEKKPKLRKEKTDDAKSEYAEVGTGERAYPTEYPQGGYYGEEPSRRTGYPADELGGFRKAEETPQPLSGYDTHAFDPQSMGGNQPYVPYTVHRHPSFNINNAADNAPAQAQPASQGQGGMGYSPFGSATPMQSPAQPISQDEARRILFSSTPQQNYQDNRMFNRDSRVNNREPIEPVTYSDQYRQSVQNNTPVRPQKVVGDAGENFGRRQSNPYGLDEPAQPIQSAQPIQPTQPVQPIQLVRPVQPAQSSYPTQDRSAQIPAPDRRSAFERPIGRTEEPIRSNPYGLDENASSVRSSDESSFDKPTVGEEPPVQPAGDGRSARRHQYMDLFTMDNPNIFGQSGNRLGKDDEKEEVAATDRSTLFDDEPSVPETQKGNADVYDDDLYSLRSYDEEPKTVRGNDLHGGESYARGERVENAEPIQEQDEDGETEEVTPTPPARSARQTADRNFLPHASSPRQQVNSIEPTAPAVSAVEKKEESAPVEKPRIRKPYVRVPLHYFNCSDTLPDSDATEVEEIKRTILGTLDAYNVTGGSIASVTYGPTLTRYNIVLPLGVSAKKVLSLEQEIAMALCREGVTVALNVGNGAISVEVPNRIRQTVELGCMFVDDAFTKAKPTSLVFAMGKDITNQKIYGDVCKMTHLLVAGSSGSGKSVFLGCLIISLITKYSPDDLRLILIDPKKTEFVLYNNLPHLMVNEIITDCKKAVQSLSWAIGEMERRYSLFEKKTLAGTYVVNIDEYNANLADGEEKLPKLVIIVDELADLMLNAKKDMEEKIQSLTQKARAAGIHLILATQRPSTDVITGVIKSNLPTRIAFTVATDVDSRVILDQTGAQKLLGKGDMIYTASGINTPIRVQSPFISSADSQRVVNFIKENNEAFFDERASSFINNVRPSEGGSADDETDPALSDPVYLEALKLAIQMKTASISMLQRKCSIGFNKAGKIIEWMEKRGFISSYEGAKARTVLITREDFINLYGEW